MTTEPSIFTRIINREIPAQIVYEDDYVIAFFTIEPISKGHTLIVPKKPFLNVLDGDELTFGKMMAAAKLISQALLDTKLATGVNLVMNNGETAGQEVFHAHLHVIPRQADDKVRPPVKHTTYEPGEAAKLASLLAEKLS